MRNCLIADSSVSDFETVLDTAHFADEQIAASSSKSNYSMLKVKNEGRNGSSISFGFKRSNHRTFY